MAYRNETGYPSSTEILKPWIDVQWFRPEHSDRGTAVHAALSAHLLGVWSPPLRSDWKGYLDSGKRWADLMVDSVILVEKRLIDKKLEYCGKPDMIVILKGDTGYSLCDWKTSAQKSPTWPLQIASYRNLACVDKKITTERGICIRLKSSGKMPIVDEYKNNNHFFQIFKSALTAYKYFKGGKNG